MTAHEIGHHINNDAIFYTGIISLVIIVLGFIHSALMIYFKLDIFTFLFVNSVGCLVFLPIILAISRWREKMADEFARKSNINKKAFSRFFKRLLNYNKKTGLVMTNNISFIGRFFLTHPWIYDRIRYF